ncbi:metallophosphoesterase [uncultured Chryseobacterium sp.]|uniref:metallophosphoesterase family protein n=1 Tax=uncultured Chryseobacterium sp. TaxID=259322 RepID=UPI0025EACA39|nr:metallophosphoesterase [uncultured Chryseobacterium sp.]
MKIIIHISDLHVSIHYNADSSPKKDLKSYLTTDTTIDKSLHFINTFISKINEIKSSYEAPEFILIITGDIANSGEGQEYKFAKKFIERIIEQLKIPINNCLIIPGDHDVNRRLLNNELIETPNKDSHLLKEIKFHYFSLFYKDIKGVDFEYNKIIFDYINIDDKLVLLAINSNYYINQNGGDGYIYLEQFRNELEELKKELPSGINFICCWHHNITANYDDKNSGQWDKDNRSYLLSELDSQGIKLIFTGNEHTPGAKKAKLEINTSDCGAFCDTAYHSSFKIYPIILEHNTIRLKNVGYNLQKTNNNDNPYYWNIVENTSAEQVDYFDILLKNEISIMEVEELPEVGESTQYLSPQVKNIQIPKINAIIKQDLTISERLYNIVREKKLFHSGHFHWSETSRAHNWIDVSKLLEDKNDLMFVKNAIIDVIESNELHKDCNLIIGLGYEGNLIASKASIKYDVKYSYLPYSYRYKDHHEYENKLNLENTDKLYKNVIIISDVVNDGRTIRKLIGKREKDFFTNVEKVIVISLFYTGNEKPTINTLNSNSQETFDFTKDENVNNIEFYPVKHIRVEKCPYGDDYAKECLIYKDELSCVNLFYNIQES